MAYNLFVLFLLVFCFPIPFVGNSAYIAVLLALFKLASHGKLKYISDLFSNTYTFTLLCLTFLLIVFSFIVTFCLGAFEFTRTLALISLLIGLLFVCIVYPSLNLKNRYNNSEKMQELLVYIFVIQSIISLCSFLLPSFKDIITIFQYSDDAMLAEESYAGFRGLALSGRLYYEFAATCGLIVIFQFDRLLKSHKPRSKDIVFLLLIIICGFFAGRTSLVGFGIGCLLLVFYHKAKVIKFLIVSKILSYILILGTVICLVLPSSIIDFIVNGVLPWVFDVFIKLFENGNTEESYSLNSLNQMYYDVKITFQEWLIGSGKYTEIDGSYYGHIDAGYLRQILYWGLIGSVLSVTYTMLILKKPWSLLKHNYNGRLFLILIFIYTLIVHYKGDLLSTSRFYYTIIYLYAISLSGYKLHKTKNLKETAF